MLIQLPVETWIEILDWLRRRDLIKKLDKLWDREFTPIVQDWLHKYTRNLKIGTLWARTYGLSVRSRGGWEKVPFAEVELPGNITSFEQLSIKYLDSTVMAFLRRMRPLFHNIHLATDVVFATDDFYADELRTTNRTAYRALMPMLNSIDSIDSLNLDYPLLQHFSVNYSAALFNAKLLEICDYFTPDATSSERLINWLFTPRGDGLPRTLLFVCDYPDDDFWEKLREHFLDSTRQLASPFFIRISNNPPRNPSVTEIENDRTGEQLSVNGVFPFELTYNCPINVDPEWLAKKEEEVREWDVLKQQKVIWLRSPEIGPFDVDESENDNENV